MCARRYLSPDAPSGECWSLAYLKVNPRVQQHPSTMATGLAQEWELAPHPQLKSMPPCLVQPAAKLDRVSWIKKAKAKKGKERQRNEAARAAEPLFRQNILVHSACLGLTSLNFQVAAVVFGLSQLIY